MEVVASLSQGRTTAAQCGLFTYKSVPVIFEPPCSRMGDRGEQQKLKERDNLCYVRVDENIILKQVSEKWHVNVK